MPAPIPDHVTQAQMQRYLETYAEVFLPPQHFALETTVSADHISLAHTHTHTHTRTHAHTNTHLRLHTHKHASTQTRTHTHIMVRFAVDTGAHVMQLRNVYSHKQTHA